MNFFEWLSRLFGTFERPSPSDILWSDAISFIGSKVQIDFRKTYIPFTKDPIVARGDVIDSDSMDPCIDAEGNTLMISGADDGNKKILADWLEQKWLEKPKEAGNIIFYEVPGVFKAIHRIISVSSDANGRYFTCKGDNNPRKDPVKIRNEHIQYLFAVNYW